MEEATREFWQRTLGINADPMQDTATPNEATETQHQLLTNLRPTARVLTRLCEQVISDEQGTYANTRQYTSCAYFSVCCIMLATFSGYRAACKSAYRVNAPTTDEE